MNVRNLMIYLMLLCTAFFWGTNFNVGKFTLQAMSPLTTAAWRFVIAAVCMLVVLWWKERPSFRLWRTHAGTYILLGIIGIFGTNALLFVGLMHTSAVNASLIMATNPLITAVLSVLILGERMTLRQIFGIAVSLAGVVFVLTGGSITRLQSISVGDLLVLAGNICWALYGVLGRRFAQRSTPMATSTFTMMVGAVCFLPFINLHHSNVSGGALLGAWTGIGFMALFGSVLAYLWWNRGIVQIGANRTAVFFNLVPVSTMVVTAISGRAILLPQILGGVLVLVGVITATLKLQRQVHGQSGPVAVGGSHG